MNKAEADPTKQENTRYMAPRTPAIIGMTSLLPERRPITGEPETRARPSERVRKKEVRTN